MLENFTDVLDNAKSALSIDELDLDFIIESIKEQVSELMESSSKKNYLKSFEKNIDNSELSEDERQTMRENIYNEIIDIISTKYKVILIIFLLIYFFINNIFPIISSNNK